ncbi:LysR family transcriptional regulator [Solihabitans fulvus]|uniref:LysR family transcriptional regulator n=1 Tax=Solihabitans fulvus TaxID=1892852 RepID=A0A5B2XAL7_9PSEU|nr:LysR family transcriptional regulator [Solihabitans fulvus]KAA2260647.1 LysR family transcriptional regulator [Solihabitans fulvus]
MQMELLRTFLAAHRAGSFTKAARQLGISQPAVTAQIRSLEKTLGKPLFKRVPQGAVPTPVGQELARRIETHVDALEIALQRSIEPQTLGSHTLYVGGPTELVTVRLLPALADLIRDGLRLRITLGMPDDLLSGLATSKLDLVVSTVRPRRRGIVATPLMDEEFALVAAPEIAEQVSAERLAAEGASALEGFPLLAYAESLPVLRHYWLTVFEHPPEVSAAVVVPDLRGVLSAVAAGAGISVLPTYLCSAALESGEIVPLHMPEVPPINTLYLATRAGALASPHLDVVRSHLLMKAQVWR